ncbi:hypothetical protein BD410DRAFT_806910 [Rickenella mellea]|uniref:Uncharacterized protein n=1 Tax=Rickenella mellea TaxID=50990 RepID=A0A4Y7PTM2_9AGAM|nr:hypothetical protein BD410DRAFT_806910 [Rickenella mellea]
MIQGRTRLSDELRALDAEAAYLEKRLVDVRAKAAGIWSFVVDVNPEGETSMVDVARPLSPVEETSATSPVASSSSIPCELGDERPEIPDNDNSSYFVWFDLESTDAIRPFEETRIWRLLCASRTRTSYPWIEAIFNQLSPTSVDAAVLEANREYILDYLLENALSGYPEDIHHAS